MRISEVMHMAVDALGIACILGIILLAVWGLGYGLVYKKIMGGTRKIAVKNIGLTAVFFCYIVVVLSATMLNRSYTSRGLELTLFASYRQAWNGFSESLWRNIFLNIAMFIPFGFMLPLLNKKCKIFWVTYLAGFGFTLFIELTQFITGRGVCEADDMLNNTWGAMIGFGIYEMFHGFLQWRKKESINRKIVILAQLPLVIVILTFCGIFLFYYEKELGNLGFSYTARVNMAKVQVTLETELEESSEEAPVYQLYEASRSETLELAETLFAKTGTAVDMGATDVYDDTIIYHSQDGNCVLWIDYLGFRVDYTNYAQMWERDELSEEPVLENASRKQVEDALALMEIQVPAMAQFEETEPGIYVFSANKLVEDDVLYYGQIRVKLNEDAEIVSMEDNLVDYQFYKSYPIRSARDAYDDFLAGKFKAGWKQDFSEVVVKDVKLQYWTDTKGYFQPVYGFTVSLDGEWGTVYIPAVESE